MVDVQQVKGVFFSEGDGDPNLPPEIPLQPLAPEEPVQDVPAWLDSPEADPALVAFPDKWKNDFIGLTYLGYLEKEVHIPFHSFVVRTLTAGEKIEILLIIKELQDVFGYNKAYKACCVAAGLVSVDGKPIIAADKKRPPVREKYEYVINGWYEPIIDLLWDQINQLELRALHVMYELGIVDLPVNVPAEEENVA